MKSWHVVLMGSLILWRGVFNCVSGASFTTEEAIAHAIRHNPALLAARFSIEEARGRLLQAGRASNPEVDSEFKPNVRGREGVVALGLTQRFPLTARLSLEKEVSRAGVVVAEAEVLEAERQVALDVAQAAVSWLTLDAQQELRDRQIANSEALATAAANTAVVGEGSQIAAMQFDLEAAQLRVQRMQLETGRAALIGELRLLLGVDVPEPIRIAGVLSEAAAGNVPDTVLSRRPDYRVLLARRVAAERTIALARANRWQDLSVGLFGEGQRALDIPAGIQSDGFAGLRLSLPLPFWNRNEGRVQEATATMLRLEKETEALALRIRSEVELAERQMAAAGRVLGEISSMLLPKSTLMEQRIVALRAEGQSNLTDLLRVRERRLQLEAMQLDARRDWHLARVRLNAAAGVLCEQPKTP